MNEILYHEIFIFIIVHCCYYDVRAVCNLSVCKEDK